MEIGIEQPPSQANLLELIRIQIEYYFSDQNLVKDEFLLQHLGQDDSGEGNIPVELIATFPKIQKLANSNLELIREALKESSTMVVAADGAKMKRKVPFVTPANGDTIHNSVAQNGSSSDDVNRTVYASYLPKGVDKNFVKKIFAPYGVVKRVDLPMDKQSGTIKGISFVEYETEEQAQKALLDWSNPSNEYAKQGIKVKPKTKKPEKVEQIPKKTEKEQTPKKHEKVEQIPKNPSPSKQSQKQPQNQNGNQNNSKENHIKITEEKSSNPNSDSKNSFNSSSNSFYLEDERSLNYNKHKTRRNSKSSSKPEGNSEWEPDPSLLEHRSKLKLTPKKEIVVPLFALKRQPRGPDGSRGFAIGRGRFIKD